MAFETIQGQKVFSNLTGQTFIFSDYFTVFTSDNMVPYVYEWGQLKQITEKSDTLTFVTENEIFVLERTAFSSDYQYLSVRAIIEGQIAENRNIKYKFTNRILPLKYLYKPFDVLEDSYFMRGVYSEKDINSCNISLVSTKTNRYLIMGGIVLAIVLFIVFALNARDFGSNWFYYLPISALTSVICVMVAYLVNAIVARRKYARISKYDPAASEEITIVVSTQGFAAIESFIYTGCDLIPWSEANFFIETHAGLVVIRDNKSVFWLPRSFIPKDKQALILALIASKVKQR